MGCGLNIGEARGVARYPLAWKNISREGLRAVRLRDDEMHLYFVNLSRARFDDAELGDAEQHRAMKIMHAQKRAMYKNGRIALRKLVCAHTKINNAALTFSRGARGKPMLANACAAGKLKFNYALSADFGLYAFAWNREVGVDLEIAPRNLSAQLVQKKFTAAERRAIFAQPRAEQPYAALCCWTRKEAYGKTLGVGVRYYLNRVALFARAHECEWRAQVAGLFAQDAKDFAAFGWLHGVQLAPPVFAAAAVMFTGDALARGKLHAFICN